MYILYIFLKGLIQFVIHSANHSNGLVSMASELKPIWDGGLVQQTGPVDDNVSDAGSKGSKPKSQAAKPAKSKKSGAKVLSSSFTCWARLPESLFFFNKF